jgi:hypothetical protein
MCVSMHPSAYKSIYIGHDDKETFLRHLAKDGLSVTLSTLYIFNGPTSRQVKCQILSLSQFLKQLKGNNANSQ